MLFDINGNEIQTNSNAINTGIDLWTKVKNFNNGFGFVANTGIDSNGNFINQTNNAVSGYILSQKNIKLRVSDISKINVAQSMIYFFASDKTTRTNKKTLETVINGNYIDISNVSNTGEYFVLSLRTSSNDFTIVAEYPKEKTMTDNKYTRSYWRNTQYTNSDETSSIMAEHFADVTSVDLSCRQPLPCYFEIPWVANYASYKMVISEYPDYADATIVTCDTYTEYLPIKNLKVNTTYFIKVIGIDSDDNETVIATYTEDVKGEIRMLDINGKWQNARDLAPRKSVLGTMVQGKLFRSANFDDINTDTFNKMKALGVDVEVDLRNQTELDKAQYTSPFEYYNITIGDIQSEGQIALGGMQAHANVIKKIVECLKQGKGVVWHCKGGADRGGVISVILEGLLGCTENEITKDYELTQFASMSSRIDEEWFVPAMKNVRNTEGANIGEKWKNFMCNHTDLTPENVEDLRAIMLTDYCPIAETE